MCQPHRTPITTTCNVCPAPAVYEIVYRDDAAIAGTCLDHFGHVYDQAQRDNDNGGAALFPEPHITRLRVRELVPA